MKLNWGTSIAIFYSLFVLVMIIMVVRASQNSVQLVEENYYNKDLNYEAFRQSRANAANLEPPVQIQFSAGTDHIKIAFPHALQGGKGTVTLYRPSNRMQDKKYTLKLDEEKTMKIPVEGLRKGYWKVLLHWEMAGADYYQEEDIVL